MPFVYIIPEDYFGPVVTLFDQPDGITPKLGPEGNEVRVPHNGIIKIKTAGRFDQSEKYPGRSVLFFVEKKDGSKQLLPETLSPWQDFDAPNRPWLVGLRGTDGKIHSFPIREGFTFDPLPKEYHDKTIILWHEPCQDRVFSLQWPAYYAGEKTAEELDIPQCGEFAVGTITQVKNWPDWMHLRGRARSEENRAYVSIDELVKEADDRAIKKKQLVLPEAP